MEKLETATMYAGNGSQRAKKPARSIRRLGDSARHTALSDRSSCIVGLEGLETL
jgi:hypothetical protein